ncbi:hypothetical protein KC19_2G172000 [Ceratodon purpureus]|uniref:Uncharacterized protein n=1 Tax=Ceratodon purpureus TaxID=3225 RepID=A0A8T0IWJ9_CERPU|nr:hypothetical protein KC19_2G172000 [Ceratodon purpureus]
MLPHPLFCSISINILMATSSLQHPWAACNSVITHLTSLTSRVQNFKPVLSTAPT